MHEILPQERPITLRVADPQGDLLDDMSAFCDKTLSADSIDAFLHRERDRLFPDGAFADRFSDDGDVRCLPRSSPCAMVLEHLEALWDRETAERYAFDVAKPSSQYFFDLRH